MVFTFTLSMVVVCGVGGVLFILGRGADNRLRNRETLALVGVGWLLAALYGALPYLISGHLSLVDAYFESMSGFTTTGATVFSNIEMVPKSLLFWRSFTHWLGGLGIILLLIIVLPFLGAGGKLLYRSEVPGVDKSGLRPQIKDSAQILFRIYAGLTVMMTVILLFAGMDVYEALCHTFGTLATGGFSTRNHSIAAFNSPVVEWVVIIFMAIAGTSFGLLFCISQGDFKKVTQNAEWRLYILLMAFSSLFIAVNMMLVHESVPVHIGASQNAAQAGLGDTVRAAVFQTVSIMTTTGYCTADFNLWPVFSRVLLVVLMFIGGCSGSTGGGLKVVRILLLFKMAYWQLEKTFRPKNMRILKVNDMVINVEMQHSILAYLVIYILILMSSTLFLAMLDLPIVTGFTAVVACLNNIGPGLEMVGAVENYAFIPESGKVVLALLMALGRLELYAICVLFLPSFWKSY